jgi:hypothetical protein
LILGLALLLAAAFSAQATGIGNKPAKIPDEFPKDIPIYQEATFRSYGPMVPANPALGTILVLQTLDEKGAVLEFYRKELPAQGWIIEKPYSDAPDSLAAHKENRRISVSVLNASVGGKRTTLIQLGVNGD